MNEKIDGKKGAALVQAGSFGIGVMIVATVAV